MEPQMNTPWGRSDSVTEIADGITRVTTASHGGIRLSRERNDRMPGCFRNRNNETRAGWYEEDCEWAMCALVFAEEFKQATGDDGIAEEARKTVRTWFPDEYEIFSGETLRPEDSHIRGQQVFHAEHANDLVVVSAVGDWHENVPTGMVGVIATVGGSRRPGVERRQFLVPETEYQQRNRHGFVIDPDRHEAFDWDAPAQAGGPTA